ncbi:MAG: hypothetical protein IT531_19715 [Burkholderiales bacterium]|nr:hypothetical protein [Burkholderiales bacterium]
MSVSIGSRLLLLTGGLLIWAGLFLFSYILAALACARGFADSAWLGVGVVPLGLVLAAVAAMAGLLRLIRHARRLGARVQHARRLDDTAGVSADVARMVCLLAAIAIAWHVLPVLISGTHC